MMTDVAAVSITKLSHRYGQTLALDALSLTLPRASTTGLIGPDGVGKSTLLSLIAGTRIIQSGQVEVMGESMADARARQRLSQRIAYMPQGLGRNLYPTLSVAENIEFHARLFGLSRPARRQRIQRLLDATGLAPFPDRAAGKLSGGMKQKLSLCCALVHSPELLILDEPTTGVDPLSRRQFWQLVGALRTESPGMSVIIATAYIEEASQFEHLLAMDDGRLLVNLPTREVLQRQGATTLEQAYVSLLPPERQRGAGQLVGRPFVAEENVPPAIEAHGLTKRFGNFTAVDHVSFRIERGEIFGFLGSNGCGKSTTMKMLTGLLDATEGDAVLLGAPINAGRLDTRMRVGYMSQAFSLYEELSVRQNLELHARLYRIEGAAREQAVRQALQQFELERVADVHPPSLPLGIRQRLQLAAACLHRPEVLILDEPTSGVDPAARDMFWRHLLKLSRDERITLFISTHFMNEAERCDRISFMHRGRVLAVGTPVALIQKYRAQNLEEAFIQYLLDDEKPAAGRERAETAAPPAPAGTGGPPAQMADSTPAGQIAGEAADRGTPAPAASRPPAPPANASGLRYWLAMTSTFAVREARELMRDGIRLFFAMMGPIILLATLGWAISFDVDHVPFAVLDRDQSESSRQLIEYFRHSGDFSEQAALASDGQIDTVLSSGQVKLVIDIPPGFGRDLLALRQPEPGFYIDGSTPFNATHIRNYASGMMIRYNQDLVEASGLPIDLAPPATIVPRYRYNQGFKSVNAVAPNVIMLVLVLIPAIMTAIGVVRERDMGSIANLYASPATVAQYLIGKQIPYLVIGLLNYLLLVLMAVLWFGVPLKGSFAALTLGAALLIMASTGLGLLVSTFVRTQSAALFATAIISLIPSINYSGLLYPLSSMKGAAYAIGIGFPASWFQRISIGGFAKGLGLGDFGSKYLALLAFALLFITLACRLLKKQEK